MLKWYENIKRLIWSKEKNEKILIFFKNTFEIQKQMGSVKKQMSLQDMIYIIL